MAAAGLGFFLAGCQGGSSSLPQAQASAQAPLTPQSVTMSIKIPAKPSASGLRRKPFYISENTQSASIAVNGGTPVIANLAVGSPNCTPASGTGRTCTVALTAPVGKDTFTEFTYANTTATGSPLSQNTTSATIVAGQANVVKIALDGVVASIAVTLTNPSVTVGTSSSVPVVVNFNDASGAAIVGNDAFANPITLTDSDTTGSTTLSTTTLNSPAAAENISLAYNGGQITRSVIGATASGVASAQITPAVLSPTFAATDTFNDWPTYQFDNQRDGYNPNTTAFTPASIAGMHLAWQLTAIGSTKAGQPLLMTNVAGHTALLFVPNFGYAQAYDALTGALVWSNPNIPDASVQDCGISGISGTAAYVKSLGALYIADGNGGTDPNHVIVYRLNAATGAVTGQVDVTPTLLPTEANLSHTGITYANGRIYVGTGSDCEGTQTGAYISWRGSISSIDPNSMALLSTFYTVYGQGGSTYGGGGVWAWGGVSTDYSGNIFAGTGNAETADSVSPRAVAAPFVAAPAENSGYGEHVLKLSPDLSTVEASDAPANNFNVGQNDLDFPGVPTIMTAPLGSGCGLLSGSQGKGGLLVVHNTATLSEVATYQLSEPNGNAYYVGNPAYSPATGYLYAAVTTANALYPPGMVAIGSCGTSVAWNTVFGPDSSLYSGENPRSAPTVTSGGVVFMGTPCTASGLTCGAPGALGGAMWALDARTGSLLNNSNPITLTTDDIRMAPIVDGEWMYFSDNSGNFYAYTIDPTVPAAKLRAGRRVESKLHFKHD
jgi:hypothetical protein